MRSTKTKPQTIDEYISTFPKGVQSGLRKLRRAIRGVVPDAEETISYQIPASKFHGKYLVYFAGWQHHISIYPVPKGDGAFKKVLARYQTGKGTLQLPIDKPLPLQLIRRIVKYRVKENLEKESARSKR